MVTIYTSKLFLDSKRKEHIRSAVGNPINMELLEKWEAIEIDKEIAYHSTQLNELVKRKAELS